jgi:hypothetical protein
MFKHFLTFCAALVFVVACDGAVTPGLTDEPITEPEPVSEPEPQPEPQPQTEPLALPSYALSDLLWERASNALGAFEKDRSNGGKAGGDGLPLSIGGKSYAKGLGMAAPSEIVFRLGGVCSGFSAEVGVADESGAASTGVTFAVYGDDKQLWTSGMLTPNDPALKTGQLNVEGVETLRLVTTGNDLANWANPALSCKVAPAALAPSSAASKGVFGPVEAWPTIPTQATLLPDGTVISWYSRDTDGKTRFEDYDDQDAHNFTIVDVWDTATNAHSRLDNTTTDLFCAGSTLGSDGNLYVAGGNLGSNEAGFYPGSRFTNIFNITNQSWSRGPDMREGRWYPSIITLPNKELLIMGGNSSETTVINYISDVWNPATNTLRRLTGASLQGRDVHPLYPWIHVAPDGRVFYTGASTQMAYLDTTGIGNWSSETYTRDTLYRGYGSSVMYEPGKILVVGGGGNTKSAVTIDLTNSVSASATSDMNFGRSNLDATLLADGSIFVNGGNTSGEVFDDTTSVYASEIWNPVTGTWQLGAEAKEARNYHSVALLLPNGTVWTAGGGGCGQCEANHQNAEIYYPPYLFKKDASGLLADRPTIISAPDSMNYTESYTLTTSAPETIEKVSLVALGSVTHAFNMSQRYVPLMIEETTATTLTITSPENANLAPPGYYMLFVINSDGVPSVARMVQVQ